MRSTLRPPRCVSLSQLFTDGYLTPDDIQAGGYVMESTRILAERHYTSRHTETVLPREVPRERVAPIYSNTTVGENERSDTNRQTDETLPPANHLDDRPRTSLSRGRPAQIRILRGMTPDERQRVPNKWTFDTCCVCYCRDKDHAARPCFHMCVCQVCSTMLTRCPLCRAPATSFQRIFV